VNTSSAPNNEETENKMDSKERASYLKGLAEGLGLDNSTPERRLISALIDAVNEMAGEIDEIRNDVADLDDDISDIDEELSLLSDEFDDLCEDDDECCCCEDEDEDDEDSDESESEDEEIEPLELDCPACGESITIDEEMFSNGRFECPHCGEVLEIDMGDAEDGCGCGCDGCEDCKEE
jgi:hypothetical protein